MFVIQQNPAQQQKERQEQFLLMEKILKQQQAQDQEEIAVGSKNSKDGKKSKSKQPKQQKRKMSTKITKKKQIQKALKNFIPAGAKINYDRLPDQNQYRQMLQANDAPEFTLNFRTFLGKVIKVTDGDTVKVAIKLSGALTRFTFRLNGVDTPESRGGQVKQYGMYVKELLRRMLEGKIVRIQAGEFDKYGRVLSRVFAYCQNQQFCINDFLIQNDLAKPYEGKTKDQFSKKDYEVFKAKYIRSVWPTLQHYPIAGFKNIK